MQVSGECGAESPGFEPTRARQRPSGFKAAAHAAARPVIHAAELVAEVLVIVVASCAAAAVLTVAALAAVRVHRWRARRSAAALPAARARELQGARLRAIEPPRRAIHGPAEVNRARARRVH